MPEIISKSTRDHFAHLMAILDNEFLFNPRSEFEARSLKPSGLRIAKTADGALAYVLGKAEEIVECYHRGVDWSDSDQVQKTLNVWSAALVSTPKYLKHLTKSALGLLILDGYHFDKGRIAKRRIAI